MKKNIAVCIMILMIVVSAFSGCIPKKSGKKISGIPDWVKEIPTDDKYVYAVGISGKTMYPTHAIKYAIENARQELATMIKTSIVSLVETKDLGRYEEISMESIAVSDSDLQGSQVVSKWVDKKGKSGVAPGTTYVLLRIERALYEDLLNRYR